MHKLELTLISNLNIMLCYYILILGCLCNTIGSVSDFCDVVVGTCECLPNVAGPDCSTCETNYWGLTDGLGCVPCSCNEIGMSKTRYLC